MEIIVSGIIGKGAILKAQPVIDAINSELRYLQNDPQVLIKTGLNTLLFFPSIVTEEFTEFGSDDWYYRAKLKELRVVRRIDYDEWLQSSCPSQVRMILETLKTVISEIDKSQVNDIEKRQIFSYLEKIIARVIDCCCR